MPGNGKIELARKEAEDRARQQAELGRQRARDQIASSRKRAEDLTSRARPSRDPTHAAVAVKGEAVKQVPNPVVLIQAAKHAIKTAAKLNSPKPPPDATTFGRENELVNQKQEIRIASGDLPDDPRLRRIVWEAAIVGASNQAELAARFRRPDLFSRPLGVRPYQTPARGPLLEGEDPFDTLYHVPKPETQAALRLVRPTRSDRGETISIGNLEVIIETTEFLLQAGQEVDVEKSQITETFDDPRLYLLGRRARVWSYSGILANSNVLQWKNRFLHLYDRFLRGSRAVETGARAVLIYDDVLREGFVLSATISPTEQLLNAVPFNFTMFVTRAESLIDNEVLAPSQQIARDTLLQAASAPELPKVFLPASPRSSGLAAPEPVDAQPATARRADQVLTRDQAHVLNLAMGQQSTGAAGPLERGTAPIAPSGTLESRLGQTAPSGALPGDVQVASVGLPGDTPTASVLLPTDLKNNAGTAFRFDPDTDAVKPPPDLLG